MKLPCSVPLSPDTGLLHYAAYMGCPGFMQQLLESPAPWAVDLNPRLALALPFPDVAGVLWTPLQVSCDLLILAFNI